VTFKIGDKVQVRSEAELKKLISETCLTEGMVSYAGEITEVRQAYSSGAFDLAGLLYTWPQEALEFADKEASEKAKNTESLHVDGAKDDKGKPNYLFLMYQFKNANGITGVPHLFDEKLRPIKQNLIDYVDVLKPEAAEGICRVAEAGAKKYTVGGWLTVPDGINRYAAAWSRHWWARNVLGEADSSDMGIPHIDHENWNLLAILELIEREG